MTRQQVNILINVATVFGVLFVILFFGAAWFPVPAWAVYVTGFITVLAAFPVIPFAIMGLWDWPERVDEIKREWDT